MPENESDPYRTSETYSGITLAEDSIQQKEKEDNGNKTRFQLKEPVEETKDLIAVHNLDETKLEKILI